MIEIEITETEAKKHNFEIVFDELADFGDLLTDRRNSESMNDRVIGTLLRMKPYFTLEDQSVLVPYKSVDAVIKVDKQETKPAIKTGKVFNCLQIHCYNQTHTLGYNNAKDRDDALNEYLTWLLATEGVNLMDCLDAR